MGVSTSVTRISKRVAPSSIGVERAHAPTPSRDVHSSQSAGWSTRRHRATMDRSPVMRGVSPTSRLFIVHQLAVLASPALRSSPRSGQGDNLGAGEVTVLDLEDTEGPMRLAPFVSG
jgi:hypothetical protein